MQLYLVLGKYSIEFSVFVRNYNSYIHTSNILDKLIGSCHCMLFSRYKCDL